MNGSKYILDTNIIIDLFIGNKTTLRQVKGIKEYAISAITLGELYYGAENSHNRAKHLKQIDAFAGSCTVIDIETEITKAYGKIKSGLKKKGKPIPENDIWIAATVMEKKLTLLTKDKHFKEIEGIKIKHIE